MKRVVPGVATVALMLLALAQPAAAEDKPSSLKEMIAAHARTNGVPESLVHRIILRESRYNARAVGLGGAMGLMQIKHATARGLGYTGPASGLLDADTNLTYGVRYLAGAYRAANGNAERAGAYYRSGYYRSAARKPRQTVATAPAAKPSRNADAAETRLTGEESAR